jgi:hypothetical protein
MALQFVGASANTADSGRAAAIGFRLAPRVSK